MASAKAPTSIAGTVDPFTLFLTTSGVPPEAVPTLAMLQAIALRTVFGRLSCSEQMANRSAAVYTIDKKRSSLTDPA